MVVVVVGGDRCQIAIGWRRGGRGRKPAEGRVAEVVMGNDKILLLTRGTTGRRPRRSAGPL